MQETLIEDNDSLKLKCDAQEKMIQDFQHLNQMVIINNDIDILLRYKYILDI